MSDFFNSGWGWFVAITSVVSLLACLWLLMVASRRKVMASDNTTGHVYDEDLVEMNNPLPRWWMVLFVLTVVFSFAYLWFFPGLGQREGSLNWSSEGQLHSEQKAAQAKLQQVYARFAGMTPQQLVADAEAMAIGERLFINTCAACHGSDARGSKGFPDLTQPASARMAPVTLESIVKTINEGRTNAMPPMAAAVGTSEDVRNLAHYVLSLSNSAHNPIYAQLGQPKFVTCAACHGAGGKGNVLLGAPNLADNYWLHGWGEQAIVNAITQGRGGVMPAQGHRFTPEQVQVLAAYVLRLGTGGQVGEGARP
jgi:cytochrome c oxidase cbb3-type subunit III